MPRLGGALALILLSSQGMTQMLHAEPPFTASDPLLPSVQNNQQAAASRLAPSVPSAPLTLVGKSEVQVRAMLGTPTSVEERAPGKTWHYQVERCSIVIQLYPEVWTRQFGTLAYEVKSDDNSDEGKRGCMARLLSRVK